MMRHGQFCVWLTRARMRPAENSLHRGWARQSEAGKVHLTGPADAYHATCQSRPTL